MKKSSLGRRSSVASQGRPSSTRFSSVEGKKSSIPKLCSGPSKPGRSSSVERESVARDPQQFGLRRSKSYLNLDFSRPSSCFMTPVQSHVRSANAYRTRMSEGGPSSSAGRLSSFGGTKSAKKESRPIADKNFQIEAQAKITEFFNKEAPELLEKGSIKPMTTAMFIDLVNFILRQHVFGLVINRNNLVDEVMRFCKTYHYRGKAEKSWLCTVNAPHSWPNVVAFLVWLVDWHQLAQSYDPFTACYSEHYEGGAEMQDYDFRNLVPCLLSGYNLSCRKNPPGDDSKEMEKYLQHYRNIRGVDESEMKKLNQEYYQLQEELNSFNAEDTADIEKIEDLEKQKKTIRDEMRQMKKFIYESEEYMKNAQEKIAKSQFHIQTCKTNEAELNSENKRLKTLKSEQTMSSEERKEIESQMASMQSDIQLLSQDIEAYQNGVYKEDLELVSQRRMFDNSIRDYNRLVSLNLVSFPELKNTLIDATLTKCMDAPDAAERFVKVDEDLNELKLHRNSQLNALELEIENIEVTRRANENELQAKQEQLEKCHEECSNWKVKVERVVDKEKQAKDRFNIAKARVLENINNEEENLEKLDKSAFDYETQRINLEKQLEKKLDDIEDFKKNADEAFKVRLDNVEMYTEKLYKEYSDCIERRKEMVREILGEEYLHMSNQNINQE